MVCLILCAGISGRWKCETPKQLVTVYGETLLQRSIRMLKERGVNNIFIVTWDQRLRTLGAEIYHSKPNTRTIETLLDTKALWDDRVVVLLGDVYYDDRAMDGIVYCDGDINFHGRYRKLNWRLLNLILREENSEIFAVTFNRAGAERLETAIRAVLKNFEAGKGRLGMVCQSVWFGLNNLKLIMGSDVGAWRKVREIMVSSVPDVWRFYAAKRGILWVAYRTLIAVPFHKNLLDRSIFVKINDITEDFDYYRDYKFWLKRFKKAP